MKLARAARCLALLSAAGCAAPDGSDYYREMQSALIAEGRLRTDTAPIDAPYDRADLARNFHAIAFRTEYPQPGYENLPIELEKWRDVVAWRILGGAATEADRARMRSLAARLSRATGLTLREATGDERADMLILYLNAEQREATRQLLGALWDEEALLMYDMWSDEPNLLCFATTFRDPDARDAPYVGGALIGIRDELPRLWRDSCLDEEVTQSLGLGNDDDSVRPSIFNDDEEFAFLTEHDEMLLRILYDPRLKPGMTEAEATPIVRRIVAELPLPAR